MRSNTFTWGPQAPLPVNASGRRNVCLVTRCDRKATHPVNLLPEILSRSVNDLLLTLNSDSALEQRAWWNEEPGLTCELLSKWAKVWTQAH
jgi:hypothetical protein